MVVIENNEARAGEIDLSDYDVSVPVLAADASNPDILHQAGLAHSNCAGVIATTNNDAVNLAISITARLLSSRLPVVARADTREIATNMAAFGTAHIINPFESFTETLTLALRAPAAWHLLDWLTNLPGTSVERRREPPRGSWILCGYNRLGRLLIEALDANDSPVTIIDLHPQGDTPIPSACSWIQGNASERSNTLEAAGIQKAVGLAVCTESDVNNLSIAVTACGLNKNLFVLMRRNSITNHVLFEAFASDFAFVPSEIIAHECLSILSTPLLAHFLAEIRKRNDEEWCTWLFNRLTRYLGETTPEIWGERINLSRAPALYKRLMHGETITLDQLLHSHANRYEYIACEVLYIVRDNSEKFIIPPASTPIFLGDDLLLAGRPGVRNAFSLNISNDNALAYILTGNDNRHGWLWNKLTSRRARKETHHLP
jgi:Trk K+ transport system NAD-binding subunit